MAKMGTYKDPEARRRYQSEWNAANTRNVGIKLNRHTDSDIIHVLENVGSVQGYIKQLIRRDINAEALKARGNMELEYYRVKPEFLPAWHLTENAAFDLGDIESWAEDIGRPASDLMNEVEPVRAFWCWVLVTWTWDSATAERIDAQNGEEAHRIFEDRCRSMKPTDTTRVKIEYAPVVAEEISGYPRMLLDGVPYWVDEDDPRMISIERIFTTVMGWHDEV